MCLGRLKRILHIGNDTERNRALRDYAANLGVSPYRSDTAGSQLSEENLIERIMKGEKVKILSCLNIAVWVLAISSLLSMFGIWAITRHLNLLTNFNWGDFFRGYRG